MNCWLDILLQHFLVESRIHGLMNCPGPHTAKQPQTITLLPEQLTVGLMFLMDGKIKRTGFSCLLSWTSWMFPITAHFVNHTHERNLGLVMLLSNSVYHCPTSHSASATVLMHTHAHTHWHGVV